MLINSEMKLPESNPIARINCISYQQLNRLEASISAPPAEDDCGKNGGNMSKQDFDLCYEAEYRIACTCDITGLACQILCA